MDAQKRLADASLFCVRDDCFRHGRKPAISGNGILTVDIFLPTLRIWINDLAWNCEPVSDCG
jgi:hypothetical protein